MKTKLKKAVPYAIIAVFLILLAVILIITDKTVRNPIKEPISETHYLTAAEAAEYQAISDKYDSLAPQYGLLEYERSLQDKLLKKRKLSEDEVTLLSTLPMLIERGEKSLENEPTLEELDAQRNALGTTSPEKGTEYAMELKVELKEESN